MGADDGPKAAGLPVGVAVAAAQVGADVQIVGKVGEDPAGDAILLELGGLGVGHVAVLRDPSYPTLLADVPLDPAESAPFDEGGEQHEQPRTETPQPAQSGLILDQGDIELALRYLPDYRVLVIADEIPEPSLAVAVAGARWSGAALVLVVRGGASPPPVPEEATVLEAPGDSATDAFADVVGSYAAALDRGEEPAEAFGTAALALGWAPSVD